MGKINKKEYLDKDCIKIVKDNFNNALYFSRNPIPYNRSKESIKYYKHIGVYGFRKNALIEFYNSSPTRLEMIEQLEQLRYLEKGKKIKMVQTDFKTIGIDTMDDLLKARKLFE